MASVRYGSIARGLHWIVATLVAVQLILGLGADRAAKPVAGFLFDQHVRVGLLVLALALAERSAALEAAEKEILDAGLPLPAEPVEAVNWTGGINAATADTATNSGL